MSPAERFGRREYAHIYTRWFRQTFGFSSRVKAGSGRTETMREAFTKASLILSVFAAAYSNIARADDCKIGVGAACAQSNLASAELADAHLDGANLEKANLNGANLSNAS